MTFILMIEILSPSWPFEHTYELPFSYWVYPPLPRVAPGLELGSCHMVLCDPDRLSPSTGLLNCVPVRHAFRPLWPHCGYFSLFAGCSAGFFH